MVGPGGNAGPLARYPAQPEAIRASADQILDSSQRIRDVGSTVTRDHRIASDAVAGTLQAPMLAATSGVVRTTDVVSAAAAVAGGALNLFASAVEAYNAGVDELNRHYEAAVAANFFVDQDTAHHGARTANAKAAIEHVLAAAEARLHARLDRAADATASMLNRGPSSKTMQFLTHSGALPVTAIGFSTDDGDVPWAPGELELEYDPDRDIDSWGLNWDQLGSEVDWLWDNGGESTWDFLLGDAIDTCSDDLVGRECAIEGIFMVGPLKLGKFGKRFEDWFEKLRSGTKRKPSKLDVDANLNALPPTVRANVGDAIERAAKGKERFPGHDGKWYDNRDGLLPSGNRYREWTASPAGEKRGAHRVIIAGDPKNPAAIYYWDHVNPPIRIGP